MRFIIVLTLLASGCGMADATGFWGKLSGKSCGKNSAGLCSCVDDPERDIDACLCDSNEGGCLCAESTGCGCSSSSECACVGEDCLCNEARCVARSAITEVHAKENISAIGVDARCDKTSCRCGDGECTVRAASIERTSRDAFACFAPGCVAIGTIDNASCDTECHCADDDCVVEPL
jgi:hypothetical protein